MYKILSLIAYICALRVPVTSQRPAWSAMLQLVPSVRILSVVHLTIATPLATDWIIHAMKMLTKIQLSKIG